jgi:hypothetical protein
VVVVGKVCFCHVIDHFISTRRGEFSASISLNVCVSVGHLLVSKSVKMTMILNPFVIYRIKSRNDIMSWKLCMNVENE